MKVIHFVPAAFEYFEDIRRAAFRSVEELDKRGVASEIITLQYGAPTRAAKEAAAEQEVKRSYQGTVPNSELLSSLAQFDIIHFHVPLLGFVGKFIAWKKLHPGARVVVSYYRPMQYSDLVSRLVGWYNRYYLKRLAARAEAVIYFSDAGSTTLIAQLPKDAWVFEARQFVSESLQEKGEGVELLHIPELAEGIIALYSQMLYTTSNS